MVTKPSTAATKKAKAGAKAGAKSKKTTKGKATSASSSINREANCFEKSCCPSWKRVPNAWMRPTS